MNDTRRKNVIWTVCEKKDGDRISFEGAQLAVLMDLRTELQKLNNLLYCSQCVSIPSVLRQIQRNTQIRTQRKRP